MSDDASLDERRASRTRRMLMQKRLTPAAVAITLALSTSAFAAVTAAEARVVPVVTTTQSRIHVMKGRVRAVDAERLVVAGPDRRLSFVLTPQTETIGDVKVGSFVDVSYHKDGKDRIASAVLVAPRKATPSTTGSRQ
jgi:hypothetical protein